MNLKPNLTRNAIVCSLAALVFAAPISAKEVMGTDVELRLMQPAADQSFDWQLAGGQEPVYPRKMIRNGARGCGIFNFEIQPDGSVTNVEALRTVPGLGIKREAKQMLSDMRWEATTDSPVATQVQMRVDFCIGGATTEEAQQMCAVQTQYACEKRT